jgi:hypothetical protein
MQRTRLLQEIRQMRFEELYGRGGDGLRALYTYLSKRYPAYSTIL